MGEILACRVCMSTNVKLYDMYKNELLTAYQIITGLEVTQAHNLPTCICGVCSILLLKCTQFKEICQRTHDLLIFAYQQKHQITTDYIESLKLNYHPLSNLSVHTVVNPGLSENKIPTTKISKKDSTKTDSDAPQRGFHTVKIEECHDDTVSDDTDFTYDITVNDEPPQDKTEPPKVEKDENFDEGWDQSNADLKFEDYFTVKFLTKEQQLEEVQARKLSTNYRLSVYKCDKCFRGFMTNNTYKNHLVKHDPSSGRYECEMCLVRLPSMLSLKDHNARSHQREYRCKDKGCSFVAKARNLAIGHFKWHKGEVYVCDTCGATFRKRTSHLSHVRLQHPSENVCRLCGEAFIGKRGLIMHEKKAHKSSKNTSSAQPTVFACDKCSVKFKTKEALQKHIASAVGDCTGFKPCEYCGENITDTVRMKEHLKTHIGSKNCTRCRKTFTNERGYALHMQQVHWKSKRSSTDEGDPVFVCEICGKKFKQKGVLTYHQRKHTGETPYACTLCPKKYALHEYLKVHIRKHKGETPYECGECPKKFADKAALSRHLRVHTGEKPYSCFHCGKCFSQSNSVKVHIQTVHFKEPTPYKSKMRRKPKDNNMDLAIIS